MASTLAAVLQLAGLAAVVVAAFIVAVPLGLVAAGCALVAVGVAVEQQQTSKGTR